MRVIGLQAENFKRLRAIDITPTGNVVKLSGANAQGKSSILDAIEAALAGVDNKKLPRPIRDGEDSARVVLDLEDLTVTRTWKQGKTPTLVVESKTEGRITKGQAALNALLGRLTFDPLEFTGMDPKTQVATLLDLVELPFDPAQLEASRKAVFERRTDVNRKVKELAAQIAASPEVPTGTPDEELSVSDLTRQLMDAQDQQRALDTAARDVETWADEVEALEERLAAARIKLEEAQAHFAGYDTNRMDDMELLRSKIGNAEQINKQVRAKANRAGLETSHAEFAARADALTAELEGLDRTKTEGLAAASMPIEGLSFDENGVTYNGVPFKQASSAEQLRVSMAMAMALNPGLRILRISDGSLLDSTSLKLIEEMAAAHDYQVWMEVVDETGTVGFVIEDGSVANV